MTKSVAKDDGAVNKSGSILVPEHSINTSVFTNFEIYLIFVYLFILCLHSNKVPKIHFNAFLLLPSASALTRTTTFEGSWKNN